MLEAELARKGDAIEVAFGELRGLEASLMEVQGEVAALRLEEKQGSKVAAAARSYARVLAITSSHSHACTRLVGS